MQHLFASRVKVWRFQHISEDGALSGSWAVVPGLSSLKCRLDLNFIRQGKDVPVQPQETGGALDRIGVMFCSATAALAPGDQIQTISGPVNGIFELMAVPDVAVDFASAHHIEVQVREVAQDAAEILRLS